MNSLVRIALVAIGFVLPIFPPYSEAGAVEAYAHRESYIIRFEETGVLHYEGGINGLRATAPAAVGARKLDIDSEDVRLYRLYLNARRAEHVAAISDALGRDLAVHHSYAITMNGVAVELTRDEADRVAMLPSVDSVRRAGAERLHTYRGPSFIGADAIWNGDATPTQVGHRGQGVVIGVIDSGAHSTHPAFANTAACGHDAGNPKLLSAVDCSVSDGGLCIGPNPEANPGNGHGVHVGSTAGGNVLDASANPTPAIPAPYSDISGVAPCAQLRSYKVCEADSCDGFAIQAAIENAIADGVDVINFSISGGVDPWNDYDRGFLDAVGAGIFVAASAGNTVAGSTPIGQVNHLSPWTMTVAASSHDNNPVGTGAISVVGPGEPPVAAQAIPLQPGSGIDAGEPMSGIPLRYDPANQLGCVSFPAGYFNDAVALIARGDCSFEDKVNNVQAAGALLAIVYNTDNSVLGMNVGAAVLPAYGIPYWRGRALIDFIEASGAEPVVVDFTPAPYQGDTLADFSLRGPTGGAYADLTKPDITGPGVNIYAAMDAAGGEYAYLSGTSMSSPHVAGAGALLSGVHPEWTPMEIKSALQTTAAVEGYKDDTVAPWDADDVGNGRVDLDRAALAGLTLDETYESFVAANPIGGTLPATQLNLPSLRNVDCTPSCTFTRTVTNRLATQGTWDVTYEGLSGDLLAGIEPSSFTLAPGESRTIDIMLAPPYGIVMNRIGFGRLWFQESESRSPPQQFSVAIKGVGGFTYVDIQTAGASITDTCHADADLGNGIVEPGETVRLSVPLRARGGDFTNVRANLAWPAPAGVTYLNSTSDAGVIGLGATASAEFAIQIDAGQACLSELVLPVEVSSDQGTFRTDLAIAVGIDRFVPADVPAPIADGHAEGTTSELTIPQDIDIADLDVRVALEHGWIGDLTIKLKSPAGTEVVLLDRPGYPELGAFGCDNYDVDVVFDDDAASDPETVCDGDVGTLWPITNGQPVEPLAAFAGESTQGTWMLTVIDGVDGYPGRITSWSLLPEPVFEPVCAVCGDPPEIIFADGFESAVP